MRDAGGFGFAAHPFSRGSERFKRAGTGMPFDALDCDALDGIELWSFVNDTGEALGSVRDLLRFVVAPARALDHPPARNTRAWDELCRRRRVVALGGLDAHQFGKRVGRFVPLRIMSYARSFRYMRTHVLCSEAPSGDLEHDRDQVYEALRAGRCYIAVDAIASARGFSFEAGELVMGQEGPAGRRVLRALTPLPARLRLLRDGREAASKQGTSLEHEIEEPGVYRIEARRVAKGRERTWILSNPIYLR